MKKILDWIGQGENSEKGFEKVKSMRRENLFLKITVSISIGWKLDLIDRKTVSADLALIEHRLSQADSNLKFYRIFDRSSNKFDRSKIWKTQIFEKLRNLIQKLLEAQCVMNEMHKYEIKSFSKTLGFNPDLPKTSFSINLSSKTQTLNTFCIKIKEHIILDGQNKFTHNIMY